MNLVRLGQLFNFSYGNSLSLDKLKISEDGIPFISRTEKYNGVSARVEPIQELPIPGHTLSVALGGSVLATFYQPEKYYTGFHVFVLHPKIEMSEKEMLAYSVVIRSNRYKYNYGRQANRTLPDILIPDMEEISNICSSIHIPEVPKSDSELDTYIYQDLKPEKWTPFELGTLFEIRKGKRLTKMKMKKGKTPFIGSIDSNNGCREYINQEPIHSGNTITVNYNGSVAEAFYQPIPFWASDDVNVLYPKFSMNEFIAMFIIAIIRREKYRFNYGRKWNLDRMKEDTIRLPVGEGGFPDWRFMESYIKTLPYTSNLANRTEVQ